MDSRSDTQTDNIPPDYNDIVNWDAYVERQNSSRQLIEDNFVEITRLPKNVDAKSLTSTIATCSKIVPKSAEICYKGQSLEVVGLVEFKSGVDAYRAVEKIRSSLVGKHWRLKLTCNPKFNNPEKELINKWLR